jgi:hypothetical protein
MAAGSESVKPVNHFGNSLKQANFTQRKKELFTR